MREQDPAIRAANFEEVCYGYDLEEAALEASRCLHCKNPRCVAACPVGIRIPDFIAALHEGRLQEAADIISEDSSLPSICGRVCPQESQCEGSCVLGIKGEPVAVGKLERFVGDWKLEHGAPVQPAAVRNGRKVAVIGSGPAGLACASDLARMGYEREDLRGAAQGGRRAGLRHPRVPPPEGADRGARDRSGRAAGRRDRDRRDRGPHRDDRLAAGRGGLRRRIHRLGRRAAPLHGHPGREPQRRGLGQRIPHAGQPDARLRQGVRHPDLRRTARGGRGRRQRGDGRRAHGPAAGRRGDDRLPPFGKGASGARRGGPPRQARRASASAC